MEKGRLKIHIRAAPGHMLKDAHDMRKKRIDTHTGLVSKQGQRSKICRSFL